MSEPFELQLARHPLHGDHEAASADDLRHTVRSILADNVALTGEAPSEYQTIGPGWVEVCPVPDVELGKEVLQALILHQLGDRDEARHSFRVGEVVLERRRVLVLLERVDATHWQLWLRRFGVGDGEVGVWHGDWEHSEGEGAESLPEPLQEWFDTGGGKLSGWNQGDMQPGKSDFEIGAYMLQWNGTLPDDPRAIAHSMYQGGLTAELLQKPIEGMIFFVWRPGGLLERWQFKGSAPCQLDELLRSICAQGDEPLCAALVHHCVVDVETERFRGYSTVVEFARQRGIRLLPYRIGAEGAEPLEPNYQPLVELSEGQGWIGIAPTVELEMFAMGPDGGPALES